jgi:hypothetical protein
MPTSSSQGKLAAWLDLDQRRIILTESIVGLHLDHRRLANPLPVHGFFDQRENVVIAAVQIDQRLLTGIHQITLDVSVTL